MRVWSLKTCDTCRKALKALQAAGFAPQVIDVRADGVLDADLQKMYAQFGDKLLNRASTTWRQLSESEKEADPLALIAQHPTLLKRPVIEQDGVWSLGWRKDAQEIWKIGA